MTGQCKSWLFAAWILLGTVSAWGHATGIQLLDQEHHIWGNAGFASPEGGTETHYDRTSPDPLDVSTMGTYWQEGGGGEIPLAAWSKAGDFRTQAHGEYWFSEAFAHSTYIFTPQAATTVWTFIVSGSGYGVGLAVESQVRFTLDDLTTGTSVASLAAPAASDWQEWSTWHLDWTHTFPLDPTHTYGMTLFAYAGHGDSTREAFLQVDLRPVIPAPGALLLAALGAAVVGAMHAYGNALGRPYSTRRTVRP